MCSERRKIALSATGLFSSDIVARIIGMGALAFYARSLPKEQMSVIPAYEMCSSMAVIIAGFGIFPTFVMNLPSMINKDRAQAEAMVQTGVCIILTGLALYSIATWCASKYIAKIVLGSSSSASLVEWMALGFLVNGVKTISENLMWVSSNFRRMSFLRLFEAILNLPLTILLTVLMGVKGLVLALIMRDTVCAGVAMYSVKNLLRFRFRRQHRFPVTKLLKMSIPFYVESYLMYFKSQGDNWIVSFSLGPASLATYYIAKRIYMILMLCQDSVDKVVTSFLANKKDCIDCLQYYISDLLVTISYIIFPGICILSGLAPSLVYIIAGSAYSDSVLPAVLLCLTTIPLFILIPLGRSVFIFTSPKNRIKLTFLETACLLPMLYVLSKGFGENGVALSRLFPTIVCVVYASFILRRAIPLKLPLRSMALSMGISLMLTVLLLCAQTVYFNIVLLPLYIFVAIIIYLAFVSLFYSGPFYNIVCSMVPFNIRDPFRFGWAALLKNQWRN